MRDMHSATIIRYYAKDATPGIFLWNDNAIAATLELPWKENKTKISCIPEGLYRCERVRNRITTGGTQINSTYLISEVKGRSGILFHVGNSVKDSNGCVLIGNNYAIVEGRQMILNSRVGFFEWLKTIGQIEKFNIKIVSASI